MEVESITKGVGAVSAVLALIGGGYGLADKMGFTQKPILKWAPEYFHISDGAASDQFKVVVARQKLRDDCAVVDFKLEVRDSDFQVHLAQPSLSTFSGPASPEIDKFGYKFQITTDDKVAEGTATLLAHIKYKCPEGEVMVNYPNHRNLNFNIKG